MDALARRFKAAFILPLLFFSFSVDRCQPVTQGGCRLLIAIGRVFGLTEKGGGLLGGLVFSEKVALIVIPIFTAIKALAVGRPEVMAP